MDSESELSRAKWMLISAGIFLISGCISWGEMVYLVLGKEVQADITKAYEVNRGGKFGIGGSQMITVEYSYIEQDGARRTGTDTVPNDWPLPRGGKVPVRYKPGSENGSRLAGHVNWFGLVFFGLSTVSMGIFGFRLWREASDSKGHRKSRRY